MLTIEEEFNNLVFRRQNRDENIRKRLPLKSNKEWLLEYDSIQDIAEQAMRIGYALGSIDVLKEVNPQINFLLSQLEKINELIRQQ